MPVPQTLKDARTALRAMRDQTARKLFARETAREALDEAKRAGSADLPQKQADFDFAQGELTTARSNETAARNALNGAIKTWLSVPNTTTPLEPDADYVRMTKTGAPVMMFPLRLETRFDIPQRTLRVRIYPDEFFSDIHERELTPAELAAGQRYWAPDQNGNVTEDPIRWPPIAQEFGVSRAAYIVRATTPGPGATLPPPRATTPSRAAEAFLPDRFVVMAFKGGELRQMRKGEPIPEPLNLTPDPSDETQTDPQTMIEVADGFKVPRAIAWTVRYDEAVAKGMAIDINNLADDELAGGFDRVVVVGVKTSLEPEDAVNVITDMFDGHHYTRGLDLVPQGTPTNNVPGQPTPFTMAEPTANESFQIERVGPQESEPSVLPDFYRLGTLFGYDYPYNVFRFIRESYNFRTEVANAGFMRRALWGSTLGYFMSQMMNPEPFLNGSSPTPLFDDATVTRARRFFVDNVCAQGPGPAFRVGAVPYGVLPAIAVSRMVANANENGTAIGVMQRLIPYWRSAAARVSIVPRVSATRNLELMNVISQKSHSEGVFIRNSVGVQTATNIFQLVLQDFGELLSSLGKTAPPVVASLGHPEWAAARVFGLNFLSEVTQNAGPLVTAHPKDGKLVTAITDPVNDAQRLNYLALLGRPDLLALEDIRTQRFMENVAAPDELLPLLYLLARHAYLTEVVEIGRRLLGPSFASHKRLDLELWFISAQETNADLFTILKDPPVGFPAGTSVFKSVILNRNAQGGSLETQNVQIFELSDALVKLSGLPVAELDRLTTETLDIASHRLDAWITGLATRRLLKYRNDERDASRPATNYFGAYGFLEDVRPVARGTRSVPNLGNVDVQPNNGGFIHAPSLRHASAAAILRSGRMAEKATSTTKYAIELPSERARRARELIDGVREGQSLGALLGFRLETFLRERAKKGNITAMEGYILALRKLYPQVGNKSGMEAGLPADRIAARNVVDGQGVRDGRLKPGGIPFGTGGLPPGNHADAQVIRDEVNRLDEIVDAVGDLVMSEAVYQIAAGDVVTAEAAMNFLPQGNNPPEPDITETPTTGIAVNHRVALILEATTANPVGGWDATNSPRAAVDPFVEDWVERQLGNPTNVTATIDYVNVGPPGGGPPVPASTPFSIADLNIAALDFLALAQSTSIAGQRSPLDRMIETLFLEGTPGATNPVISYDTPDPPGRSIPQLMELARALGAVLGGARELAAADLRRAEDGVLEEPLGATAAALKLQAQAVVDDLKATRGALDGTNPDQALRDAAAYLADAFPDRTATAAAVDLAAVSAKAELSRRVTEAQAAVDGANASALNSAAIASAILALRTVFGRNTLAVLPAAVPQGGSEIKKSLESLARGLDLSQPDVPTSFDPHQAPGRFLQQASRVHEQLGAWRRYTMYAGAFGAAAPLVSVAQLPFVTNEQWAGRAAPPTSRTSLILVSANGQTAAPNASQVWRGLLLDQWTEIIPSGKAETGLAFHYDSQNAEAPQVILMGVHSGATGGWSLAELHSIVNETMDLAQMRPVDSDIVALGQLVPPICIAFNSENNVVSTMLGPEARQGPPRIG